MRSIKLQDGFTIVELMIATMIFAIILVLCVTSAVQIGRMFYKGISESRAQQAVRSITESITRPIQLSGRQLGWSGSPQSFGKVGLVVNAFCVGTTRYSYTIDLQVDDGVSGGYNQATKKIYHALWQDQSGDASNCIPQNLTLADPGGTNGRELVPAKMALRAFTLPTGVFVPPSNSFWTYTIKVQYGDSDLWTPTGCLTNNHGGDFCGSAEMTTSVFRRITPP